MLEEDAASVFRVEHRLGPGPTETRFTRPVFPGGTRAPWGDQARPSRPSPDRPMIPHTIDQPGQRASIRLLICYEVDWHLQRRSGASSNHRSRISLARSCSAPRPRTRRRARAAPARGHSRSGQPRTATPVGPGNDEQNSTTSLVIPDSRRERSSPDSPSIITASTEPLARMHVKTNWADDNLHMV